MQAAPLSKFERDSRVPLDQMFSIYIMCKRIKRVSVLRRNITAALYLLNILIKSELSLLSDRFVLIALCKIQLLVCLKSVQKTYSLDKPNMEEKSALKFVHLFEGDPQRVGT